MPLYHRWRFLRGYLREPQVVGALVPGSRALASALCEPFRRFRQPATVLEVGAGTGSVTRHLGALLQEGDRLDVCEIRNDFADILERDVLSHANFADAMAGGRVQLLRCPVQEIGTQCRYDFVISGLPLTTFALRDVQDVLGVIRRSLKPGGILSYFEYVGLRSVCSVLAVGRGRSRIRSVSAYLSRTIAEHQFFRRTVFGNLPPAHARHLCFEGEPNFDGNGNARQRDGSGRRFRQPQDDPSSPSLGASR